MAAFVWPPDAGVPMGDGLPAAEHGGMVARMDQVVRRRIIAGAVAVGAIAFGSVVSGSTIRESRARVIRLRADEVTAEQAQQSALARKLNFVEQEGFYAAELREDVSKWKLEPIELDRIKQVNAFHTPITRPLTLSPGSSWSSAHMRLEASVEKVTFQQRGAAVAARHSVITAQNVGQVPIAYNLRVGPDDGRTCKARGARMHNAMALWPGETAEIVVCAGAGRIRIDVLQILEITPVGYHYVSQVPPVAVGHDAVTSQAHRPPQATTLCTQVPAVRLAEAMSVGEVAWADIIDFYSRHDCHAHQYIAGYARAAATLERLPITDSK